MKTNQVSGTAAAGEWMYKMFMSGLEQSEVQTRIREALQTKTLPKGLFGDDAFRADFFDRLQEVVK